jgi:prevent-host-death family protein
MLDIRPISDLRNDFTDIEKRISDSDKPIIFTKNGRGSMVLVSLDRFSRMAHLDYIEQSLDEADSYARSNSENMAHEAVFTKLRTKING